MDEAILNDVSMESTEIDDLDHCVPNCSQEIIIDSQMTFSQSSNEDNDIVSSGEDQAMASLLSSIKIQLPATLEIGRDYLNALLTYPSINCQSLSSRQTNVRVTALKESELRLSQLSLENRPKLYQKSNERTKLVTPKSQCKSYVIMSPKYGCNIKETYEVQGSLEGSDNLYESQDQRVPCYLSAERHLSDLEDSQDIDTHRAEVTKKLRERRYEKGMKQITRQLRSVIPIKHRKNSKRNILGSAIAYVEELEAEIKDKCLQLGLEANVPPQLICAENLSESDGDKVSMQILQHVLQNEKSKDANEETRSKSCACPSTPKNRSMFSWKTPVRNSPSSNPETAPSTPTWSTPLIMSTSSQDQSSQDSPCGSLSKILLSSCQSISPQRVSLLTKIDNMNTLHRVNSTVVRCSENNEETPDPSTLFMPPMLYLDEGVAGASACLNDYVIVLDEGYVDANEQGNVVSDPTTETCNNNQRKRVDLLAEAMKIINNSPIRYTQPLHDINDFTNLTQPIYTSSSSQSKETSLQASTYVTPSDNKIVNKCTKSRKRKCVRKLDLGEHLNETLEKKRPNNLKGFHYFYKSKRELFRRRNPELTLREVRHQLGVEWRSMPLHEKSNYVESAEQGD